MKAWLAAFALTQLIEAPIYAGALGSEDADPARGWPSRIALALLPSALTHPVVWFVFPMLISGSWPLMVLLAETFAVLAEAALLRAIGLRRAILWALLANGASLGLGLLLRVTLGVT